MDDHDKIAESLQSIVDYKNGNSEGFREFDVNPCKCPTLYTLEHGPDNTQTLFYGRCNHRHGLNLFTLSDIAFNANVDGILKTLNNADLVRRFLDNVSELMTGGCLHHSGNNTPPFVDFLEKYSGCVVCRYNRVEELKQEKADFLDELQLVLNQYREM